MGEAGCEVGGLVAHEAGAPVGEAGHGALNDEPKSDGAGAAVAREIEARCRNERCVIADLEVVAREAEVRHVGVLVEGCQVDQREAALHVEGERLLLAGCRCVRDEGNDSKKKVADRKQAALPQGHGTLPRRWES